MNGKSTEFVKIASLRSIAEFQEHIASLGYELPVDEQILSAAESSPLAQPIEVGGYRIGNRWCVHPMEGWDGTPDGQPSKHTIRRWEHFGQSGAKLIWGGEAFAVREDGRANPNQLFFRPENKEAMRQLLNHLKDAHRERFGAHAVDDLLVGLQLTHSGRFCRPRRKDLPEPLIAYHHPVLDQKFGIDPTNDKVVLKDEDIPPLIDAYVEAAKMAEEVGFQFVDVKACHGYLGHEFLSAFDRPGPYGGDLMGRSRFLREIITAIRSECPRLMIGVRMSIFDFPPFRPDPNQSREGKLGPGIPHDYPIPYPGFGCDRQNPLAIDLREPIELLRLLHRDYGVMLVNLTAGSPYYNPHIQRPALYPPSDGYQPPEDPLVGCLRQIHAVKQIKQAIPQLVVVGSAYTYFQEFLPQVAQGVIRAGWTDFVGIGRLVLAYWDLPADTLAGRPMQTKRLCRTFSDCTTGPRNGLISGCYPLDPYYKELPEFQALRSFKSAMRAKSGDSSESS
ncbi:MAG: NADH:flavin oxidoreductase [Thermogutta sp.]